MNPALKPCPFCGASNPLVVGEATYAVQCAKCHAKTERTRSHEEAAELWNRRTVTGEMIDRAAFALLRRRTSGPDADGFAREQWEQNLSGLRSTYRREARAMLGTALNGGAE